MKKITAFMEQINTVAQQLGLRKPPVISPPTDYQKHVAQKAKELLELMESAAQDDNYMADMVSGMKTFLEMVIDCKVTLPSQKLSGWTWYFLYENPERLDIKYPEICSTKADLNYLMYFDSFEKLEASKRLLKSINN